MTAPNPLRGILLFTLGVLLFACMDTTAKYLVSRYDVPLVVAARYIGNLLLMSALLAPRYGKELIETQRTGLVVVRALCLAASSLLVGFALQRMPVAETTAINFLAPMLVVLVAGPLLGERAGIVGWGAALAGFGGVLLIARPGSGLDPVGVACALLGVGAAAGYQILSRVLVASERTIALLFYTALVGSILFGLAAPWFLGARVPDAFETLLLCSLGVYGGLGHYLITAAYRDAPASVLAPVNYLQLLWAGLLGWIVFGHMPDRLSLIGMAIIAAAGAAVALHSRRLPVKRSV
ncbi:MAG: DMT family transporter [Sphingomonadales bacterium]|nr:MAG: DMT family transporter [Sphingomonadales bacterium]